MNNIINLTPHPVNIYNEDLKPVISLVSAGTARCKKMVNRLGVSKEGIPIFSTSFRQVEGLPPATKGTYYIVSRHVFSACPERTDLLMPEFLVRNIEGEVIGCKGLSIHYER